MAAQWERLLNRPPARLWGGSGTGALCAVCERIIEDHEMEYEVEFVRIYSVEPSYHLHVRCFMAWEANNIARKSA
jgi:hypothetical protein